jgi:large subunit ribosomal protein L5
MARLKEIYENEVIPAMIKKFGYKSIMEIPKIEKIVINMGFGDIKENPKAIEATVNELALISGQRPIVMRAKRSVANFKLREGMPVGAKVTLRGKRMYEFADRLLNIALPRVRDFRGVNPNAFSGFNVL